MTTAIHASALPRYRGQLTPTQLAEGINTVRRSAARLLSDAEALLALGRAASAGALAILSIEESGKVPILYGLALIREEAEIRRTWANFRRHTSKNAFWAEVGRFLQGAREPKQFRDPAGDAFLAENIDALKQLYLYADCLGAEPGWVSPDTIPVEAAQQMVRWARALVSDSSELAITARDIELWVEHFGPVAGSGDQLRAIQAMRAMAEAMHRENLPSANAISLISEIITLHWGEVDRQAGVSEADSVTLD